MKPSLIMIAVATMLVGCESTHSSMTAPSLDSIEMSVGKATVDIEKAEVIATKVYEHGAMKNDPEVKKLGESLKSAKTELATAKVEIKTKQGEVDAMTKQANKVVDRLNYLEPKYAASVGIIWKWRFVSLGLGLFIAAYGVAKFYFHIPFI